MASWILVPCLVKLRSEFNAIAPNRDKSSDGSVGDLAHQSSQSDHNPDETGNVPIRDADKVNEVHAIDVDVDLRTPGLTMEMVVQFLLARCRSGAEQRLRYIIYDRRIWEAKNGWRERPYTGANPHDKHAHFSSSYETNREASIASWRLEDLVATIKPADVWAADVIPVNGRTDTWQAAGTLGATYDQAAAANRGVNQLIALVGQLAGRDMVDEPAIIAGVLAGLNPAAIAAAVAAALPADQARRVVDELAARLAT